MIEIICNKTAKENDEKEEHELLKGQGSLGLKNIKQIGEVDEGKKIYIEDYAFTYIHSVANSSLAQEQSGILLGNNDDSGEKNGIFIKGVVRNKNIDNNPQIHFNEKIWKSIYADIEKYFPSLNIVGWFAAIPDVNSDKMNELTKLHLDNFAGNMKTLYIINKNLKEEGFYLYEDGELKKQKGYVCFYERNYEMQEYMLQKRGQNPIEAPGTDKVMKSIRQIIAEKEAGKRKKKNRIKIYCISAFMAAVVLVIGINLINSYEKMSDMDQSIENIAMQMSNINNNDSSAISVNSDNVSVGAVSGNVFPTESTKATENTSKATIKATENTSKATIKETEKTSAKQEETEDKSVEKGIERITQTETEARIVAATPEYDTYIVKRGDTISSICRSYYGTISNVNSVASFNNISDANKLYVGQEIKLPY